MNEGTELERLVRIETKLDNIPGLVSAAINDRLIPLIASINETRLIDIHRMSVICEEVAIHNEKIAQIKIQADTLGTRLWQVAVGLATILVGEVIWVWHSIGGSILVKK